MEDFPGTDIYSFVFQNEFYQVSNDQVELTLKNLKSVLDIDKPVLDLTIPQLCPNTCKNFKISVGEKTNSNNIITSEHYIESSNDYEQVALEEIMEVGEEYLVVIQTDQLIESGDISFINEGNFQELINPIKMGDEVWIYATISDENWSEIVIPTYAKVTIYKDPIQYEMQTAKFILNGGENRKIIASPFPPSELQAGFISGKDVLVSWTDIHLMSLIFNWRERQKEKNHTGNSCFG